MRKISIQLNAQLTNFQYWGEIYYSDWCDVPQQDIISHDFKFYVNYILDKDRLSNYMNNFL